MTQSYIILWLISMIVWLIGMWNYKQDHEPTSILEACFMSSAEITAKILWTAFCIIVPLIAGYFL